MSLVTVADVRRKVQTDLDDVDLQSIIDNEESEVIRRYGAHGDGVTTVTEVVAGGQCGLFLSRPVASITSVSEVYSLGGSSVSVAATAYQLYATQGRLGRISGSWGALVTVVYAPTDDRARRRQVIVELVRLALEQTAMKSESVAGEYSYSAPDWEMARGRLLRRLAFQGV